MDEFEIKLQKITREQFLQILKSVNNNFKSSSFEKSLNIIQTINNKASFRRTTFYDTNAKKISKESIIIKKEVIDKKYINNVYNNDIVISHSKEFPLKNHSFTDDILIRLRERLSFDLNDNYRLDCTVIKNEQDINSLDTILNKFFKGFNEKNFTDKELFIDKYEIEIEYIGSSYIDINMIENKLSDILIEINMFKNPINEIFSIITNNSKKYNIQFRDIVNQVKMLDKFTYYKYIYPANGYILLEKTDGERCICALLDSNLYLLFTKKDKNLYKKLDSKIFNKYNFIFDCEYLDEKILVFDILYLNNQKIFSENYINRLEYKSEAIKITNLIDIFKIEFKKYNIINNNFKNLIESYYIEKKDDNYKIDGLILSEPDKNYFSTTNYKWKSFEDNTIDFYCKLIKDNLYYLYSYVSIGEYKKLNIDNFIKIEGIPNLVNVLFSPSIDPKAYTFHYKDNSLNNKVVELGKDRKTMEWKFHKIRNDKDFGNHIQTAEMTYYNYYSPFDIEMLYEIENSSYFSSDESHDKFKDVRIFNTKIKYNLFSMFKDNEFVLDLAAGRGADLNKYNTNNIKNVLMVEVDDAAIHEAIERKYNLIKDRDSRKEIKTKILILKQDLTDNYLDIYDKIIDISLKKNFNSIICNFAIHYLIYNSEKMNNFVNLIKLCLDKNGIFITTLFDGNKLKQFLLNQANYTWQTNKYYIRLLENKKQIELLLPFSGNERYKEYLIDINELISVFKKNGIKLVDNKNFLDFDVDYNLTEDDDKTFVGFYTSLTFIKK